MPGTKLSKKDEAAYQLWRGKLPKPLQYEGDYDLRGLYQEDPKATPSSNLHFPDTYKLPNHPTFSNQSKYFLPYGAAEPNIGQAGYWQDTDSSTNYIPYDPNMKKPVVEMKALGGKLAQYGMGGNVGVEVEGGEGVQLPNGQYGEVQGPSHENGGVPVALPEGTNVYSDRLAINGETMQDRKKRREKAMERIDRAMKRNPNDALRKATRDRLSMVNQAEDSRDMAMQNIAGNLYPGMAGGDSGSTDGKKMWNGGPVVSPDPPFDPGNLFLPSGDPSNVDVNYYTTPYGGPIPHTAAKSTPATANGLGMTLGDSVGMFGNALGSIAPLLTTLANRKGDTPNKNAFLTYGKDGLNTVEQGFNAISTINSNQQEQARINRNSANANNRNGASSINTLRALDIATGMAGNKELDDISNNYASQDVGLLNQKAGMQNQRDQMVQTGDYQRDLADRQDRDNYFSNMSQSLSTLSTGVMSQGKYLNQAKGRNDFLSLLPDLSPYGIGLDYDNNGKIVIKQLK